MFADYSPLSPVVWGNLPTPHVNTKAGFRGSDLQNLASFDQFLQHRLADLQNSRALLVGTDLRIPFAG